MSLITPIPTYSILVRQTHRFMGSFDHDSSFLPRTHDDTNIFSHDLNPIMDHNSSHLSRDEDESLRDLASQVGKLSHEFDNLESWIGKEHQNHDSVASIEALNKLVNNYDNNISIFHGMYHLINTHAKSLTECAQELGYPPPSTTVEPSILISTTLSSIPTYVPPIMTNSTQVSTPLSVGLSNLSLPMSVPPTCIPSLLP